MRINSNRLVSNVKLVLFILVFFVGFSQVNAQEETVETEEALGLPGDNLNLYAALDLFQDSKTIEAFEASLNEEKTGINNLDLNLDGNVDFIKVITKKEGDNFTFVLQTDVSKDEVQDIAVILVSKSDDSTSLQMVGDEALYGKDYVIEPKLEVPAATANPAYTGDDADEVESQQASVVVVQSEPIVEYIYSPVYVPYYSPYYYGYYPPYFHPFPIVSFHVYYGRHRYYSNRYYGGHRGGNTVVINNRNSYNSYQRTRSSSSSVSRNKSAGNYTRSTSAVKSTKATRSNAAKSTKSTRSNAAKSTKADKLNNTTRSNATKSTTRQSTKPANRSVNTPTARPSSRPASRPTRSGGRRR